MCTAASGTSTGANLEGKLPNQIVSIGTTSGSEIPRETVGMFLSCVEWGGTYS